MSANTSYRPDIAGRLHALRERITRRMARPVFQPPHLNLPLLDPLKAARRTASSLAAAIGTVNPRPPGLINDVIQTRKRSLARILEWTVRPQREFNRAVVDSLARTTEVLESMNQNLLALAEAFQRSGDIYRTTGEEMDSLHERMDSLREELIQREVCLLEELAQKGESLRGEFNNKIDQLGEQVEEKIKLQQWAYDGALARQSTALQDRMYALLGDLQQQMGTAMAAIQDQIGTAVGSIQEETRLLRQRVAAQARAEGVRLAGGSPPATTLTHQNELGTPAAGMGRKTSLPAGIDYFQLERHFRGTEDDIRRRQGFYLPFFAGRQNVLDIACGRGEFLELMREAQVNARGVDIDADMVGRCLEKGLSVVQADVFSYLETVPNDSLDGIFCAQFVEHLEPDAYVRLVSQCAEKLAPAGILTVETQNPECLAIFSQTFFLDPTHVRPIPPALLRVLFAEAGLERLTTHFLSRAADGLPLIPQLASSAIEPDRLEAWNSAVTRFNETFFGGMDYAVIGYRSASRLERSDTSNNSSKTIGDS